MNGQKIEQHVARVKNAQIYYEVSGEGPAVVLLHGLSGSTRWWRKNVPVLSRRYRVYAIDMIGFGRSRGQPFVMQETAGRIIDWMDGLGEERFHLVGHSMGGLVSAEIAAQCPEQVGRVVLVDAVALPLGHSILRSAINLTAALRHVPVDFLPVLVKDALRAGPLTLLKASYSIHQVDLRPDLARIAARTLIVWGEWDTLLPVSSGEALHQVLPGSDWVVIEGAGHNPMWDRPEVFNRVVMEFLEE